MNRYLVVCLLTLMVSSIGSARIMRLQPYETLFEHSDVVAIVELKSLSPSDAKLEGHGTPDMFDAKVAHFTVGLVLKGDPELAQINLLHFTYAKGVVQPNGAMFLQLSDAKTYQYLVFLKKDAEGNLSPVTGQYDASLSVKKILKDHFSPIPTPK